MCGERRDSIIFSFVETDGYSRIGARVGEEVHPLPVVDDSGLGDLHEPEKLSALEFYPV